MSWFKTVIIAVEGSGPTGGAERVAFDTVALLSQAGYQVHILSSAASIDPSHLQLPNVTGEALNLPVVWEKYFSKNRILSYPLRKKDRALEALYEPIFKRFDPATTLVHVHGFHTHFSHSLMEVSLRQGFATHLHAHDYGFICPNATLFDYPTNSICHRPPLSAECKSGPCMGVEGQNLKLFRFERAKSAVALAPRLASIISPSPYASNLMRQSLGEGPNYQVVRCPVTRAADHQCDPKASQTYLWIGRMTAEKNAEIAIKAADLAGIQLTLVGDGPLRADLQKRYPNHHFLGWKSTGEVQQLQRQARALIMSSAWYETASLVVLECLAAGIPVIIGKDSAATSWVTHGQNGLYFENGSVDSLADAMRQLSQDDLVAAMGLAAYTQYHADPCTDEAYLHRLLEVYQSK